MLKKTPIKVILSLVIIALLYFARNSANLGHDFQVFVYAGGKLIRGQDIYSPPFIQNLQYYNSPLFALILSPFANLPIIIPQIIWIFLSYYFLYRIWVLSLEYFETEPSSEYALNKKNKWIWLTIALALSCRFIVFDLGFVQLTVFLLWCTLQSLQLVRTGKDIGGAALLALAINIKFLPLPFVLYLLYRKKIRAALFTCLFFVAYLFVPAMFLGWDRNMHLLTEWFNIINPGNKEWTIEAEDGPSSLVALIPVYLTNTKGVLSFKRNFINLDFRTVSLILNVVRLFFVVLTLAFLKSKPFVTIGNKVRQYWEMCYIFLAIPLLFPHQQVYAYVYIIPVFIYLSWYFVRNWADVRREINVIGWLIIAVIALNFSPLINKSLLTSRVYEMLLYLRVLPVMAIALIPLLWIFRPKRDLAA